MPDFPDFESGLDAVRRADRIVDALASGRRVPSSDPGDLAVASLLAHWRDDIRRGPVPELVSTREAAAALRRAQPVQGRTRFLSTVVGAVAAALLSVGGFGAIVYDAHPGDTLYGLRTMVFGEAPMMRNDHVTLAAQTELAEAQQLITEGKWQQAQDKLVAASTTVQGVDDAQRKQQLVDQMNQLAAKVEARDPNATLAPGAAPPAFLPAPAVIPGPAVVPGAPASPEATTPSSSTTTTATTTTSPVQSPPQSPAPPVQGPALQGPPVQGPPPQGQPPAQGPPPQGQPPAQGPPAQGQPPGQGQPPAQGGSPQSNTPTSTSTTPPKPPPPPADVGTAGVAPAPGNAANPPGNAANPPGNAANPPGGQAPALAPQRGHGPANALQPGQGPANAPPPEQPTMSTPPAAPRIKQQGGPNEVITSSVPKPGSRGD